MSYLDLPRLTFAGQFQADVPTVDNVPSNYNNKNPDLNPLWNPMGSGAWRLRGCSVTRVTVAHGLSTTGSGVDPVVGTAITGADDRAEAKLVDLDPEQQMASQIWGFQMRLCGLGGSPGDPPAFVGNYRASPFQDFWIRATGSAGGDAPAGAFYHSILEHIEWGDVSASPCLQQLKAATEADGAVAGQLSVKFNLDLPVLDSSSPDFTFGRIVGSIGPVYEGEPWRFLKGRCLRPSQYAWITNPLYFGYAKVDDARQTLVLDVGNSLPTDPEGQPTVAGYSDFDVQIQPPDRPFVSLGTLSFSDSAWYTQTAGIVEFPLSDINLELIRDNPVGIVANSAGYGEVPLLRENPQGLYINAEDSIFRLNPGETAETRVLVTRFGAPAAGQEVSLEFATEQLNMMQNAMNPSTLPTGLPTAALELPPPAATGTDGWVSFELRAHDPDNPRHYIDGQVYGVGFNLAEMAQLNYSRNNNNFLSVLVWDHTTWNDPPTWWGDVQPILYQYSRLYPVMKQIMDLGDYETVVRHAAILRMALSLPVDDPAYMPVTRDLSKTKREMILTWLEQALRGHPLLGEPPPSPSVTGQLPSSEEKNP